LNLTAGESLKVADALISSMRSTSELGIAGENVTRRALDLPGIRRSGQICSDIASYS
jgi:hypothetical protein